MPVKKIIVTQTYLLDAEIVGSGPFTHRDLEGLVEDGEALSGTAMSTPVDVSEDDIEDECQGIGEDPAFFEDAF